MRKKMKGFYLCDPESTESAHCTIIDCAKLELGPLQQGKHASSSGPMTTYEATQHILRHFCITFLYK